MYLFYGKPRHNLTYLFVIIPKNLYHKTLDFIFPHTNVHNYNYYNILLSFIQFSFLFRFLVTISKSFNFCTFTNFNFVLYYLPHNLEKQLKQLSKRQISFYIVYLITNYITIPLF